MQTVFRGTLRYKGFARLLNAFSRMGFLSTQEADAVVLKEWNELGSKVLGRRMGHGRLMGMSMDRMPAAEDYDDAMNALEQYVLCPRVLRSLKGDAAAVY